MKVGILGLPQTGKTSLYNALTRSSVDLKRFGGSETHVGVIPVPDERFDYAVQACAPKKVHPATIEVTEGGARIEREERAGHGQGEKFGTDFFAGVRNMDALILVVRAFDDPAVPEPPGGIAPEREVQRVLEELLLADLTVVDARLEKLEKARLQKRQSPAEAAEQQALTRIHAHLDSLKPVRTLGLSDDEERSVRSFAFVSGKPLILVANVSESDAGADEPESAGALRALAAEEHIPLLSLCAKVEMEIAQMAPEEEREFLAAMGIPEAARDRLIRAAYAALGQISFFTVGPDEVRAWTIARGTNAVGAAEKIHSDLARGFIRAEVMPFEDFRSVGAGWDEAKSAGKMRLEGKDYIVKDGEIVHIRFKV
jgi:GTP-binding protein YchF